MIDCRIVFNPAPPHQASSLTPWAMDSFYLAVNLCWFLCHLHACFQYPFLVIQPLFPSSLFPLLLIPFSVLHCSWPHDGVDCPTYRRRLLHG